MTLPPHTPRARGLFLSVAILCCTLSRPVHPQAPASTSQPTVTLHATGTFDVRLDPQPSDERSGGPALSRLLLDKHFHGDLEATSKGTMLAAGNPGKGNGGYVALELVTGSLKGRTGTFALQHTGALTSGAQLLTVTVVPGSGTAQLTGLSGSMNIIIHEGQHSWTFDYTLPPTP